MSSGDIGTAAGCSRPANAVVIPMYNEVAGARRCVETVLPELHKLGQDWFLIVVDDGSNDGTALLLDELRTANEGLRVVHQSVNRGYGAALRTGASLAAQLGAEWALFMDSDLTNPPGDISRFARAMTSSVDYVKASRYMVGGATNGVPFKRWLISRTGNLVAGRLMGLPLSDITNGFRAIRSRIFVDMPLKEQRFALIAEEAYWAARWRLRCAEIPTILANRDLALRGTSFRYSPKTFYAYGRFPLMAAAERGRRQWQVLTKSDRARFGPVRRAGKEKETS
jgi:dolichol-phosphate mannosyltransferase